MKVNVKLVGAFRLGRFKEESRDYRSGTRIQDVLDSLQLPEQILGIVLINGVHAELDDLLHDGDSLTVLPILDGG
ncbi:MAG: molybdopterin synthase sulfur carrier subunit [Desulfuromonadales bacterium C00003093]|nr:MoaD/ThiS family protein [Desulfuromonadaceae bacterium]OEU73151.1 MAG: molybdopterin synthase sulfur carrier subunit [Desulfuromonadales bacterium C00003093]